MKSCPTEKELLRLCEQWQVMLRLQHWKIRIEYANTRQMIDEEGHIAWGRCSLNENHLRARILILHPDDYEDDDGREEIEKTIVHELLHILLMPMRRDPKPDIAADVAEEQAINVLADLLVNLYHL